MLTKPPPSPPIAPKPITNRTWVDVLREARYPTDVIVLDFETYFDETYSMRSMSTLDYITDSRFEVVSLAITTMRGAYPADDYKARTEFVSTEFRVGRAIEGIQAIFGDDLCSATVLIQNAKFDASVLAHHYGFYPKYVVDLLGIARALHPRAKHGLKYLCERYKLEAKGETANFSGATFRTNRFLPGKSRKRGPKMPIAVPPMTAEKLDALRTYNCGDNFREWELFVLLAPQLSNPAIELRLQQHTLELFTRPTIRCDFVHGENLITAMQARTDQLIVDVARLYGD